jgi:transcriptional regulator with XRE-family HTH domain
MGEYWDLLKTFAALRTLREQQGLSITDLVERTGMDRAMISRLETGQLDNPTLGTINRYARALGKRVVVSFRDAAESNPR